MAYLNDGTIRLGYNGVPWQFSETNADVYTFEADPIRRKLRSFGWEAINAAKEIRAAYGDLPIYVLYSGGIDSEAVVHAFFKAGIPITAVCIKFPDSLNEHELGYAFDYFKKYNYPLSQVKLIDFDIRAWLRSNEATDLARDTQTPELGYTHLFKVALDHLSDGVVITGHEEPLVQRVDSAAGSKWVFHCHERHYSIHKFFIKYGRPGVPSFFQWSTEFLNSFMHNDHWLALFNNLYSPMIWNTEHLKYGFLGKELGLTARKKYTSFERLIPEIVASNNAWKDQLPVKWSRSCDVEINAWYQRCGVRTKV